MSIVGRKEEIILLQGLLKRSESEFVAVYGRRRIGKTYLIRQTYSKQIIFDCGGLHEQNLKQQLENFWLTLKEFNKKEKSKLPPETWLQAFSLLKKYIQNVQINGKKIIFLDEISWFETPRSGFLAALDNFWNQFCNKRNDVILVICGSAASWIINKVINNRGGLHNRITTQIQLMPFTLAETDEFLKSKHIKLVKKDVAQLYMSVGGVPFYLKDIEEGKSLPQILDALFFKSQAILKNEYSKLYASLFNNSHLHEAIVKALITKNKGLTRSEIIKITKLKSGGGLTNILKELIQCGFVRQIIPINKTLEDSLYRLIDEFTIFYLKFLIPYKSKNSWQLLVNTPTYKTWTGYAFENICFKHVYQIKKALGISGLISSEHSWTLKGNAAKKGSQIDMLLDRNDNCISLLEVKFYNQSFVVTKAYAEELRTKINTFKTNTKTTKNVFLTLLTIFGAEKNAHYLNTVTNQLVIEDLFT